MDSPGLKSPERLGRLFAGLKPRASTMRRAQWAGYFLADLREPRRAPRRAGRSSVGSPISSAVQIEVTNFFKP